MAYIKNELHEPGEVVKTTIEHKDWRGTFEVGSTVTVIGVSKDGYNIQDKFGNVMTDIGFKI